MTLPNNRDTPHSEPDVNGSDPSTPRPMGSGMPFAPLGGMNEQEHNNLAARVRTLEALLNQLAYTSDRNQAQLDKRLQESHATWETSVNKILLGITETRENLYHPTTGAFVRLDRLEHLAQSQTKLKLWLTGFLTSGALLILGSLLGRVIGK